MQPILMIHLLGDPCISFKFWKIRACPVRDRVSLNGVNPRLNAFFRLLFFALIRDDSLRILFLFLSVRIRVYPRQV